MIFFYLLFALIGFFTSFVKRALALMRVKISVATSLMMSVYIRTQKAIVNTADFGISKAFSLDPSMGN